MQRLAELCVRRPILSSVITLALVVLGVFSFQRLNVSRYPDVELPIITVITQFPGAAPGEIETALTRRIEDAVSGIGGIDTVTSTSADGVSVVVAQFVLEKNVNVAAQEVQDKVSAIGDFPAGTAPPRVLRFDPNQIPVAVLALSASRPVRDISEYADRTVKAQRQGILGVAQVNLAGEQLRQINVQVDPYRLAGRRVTAAALLNALQVPVEQAGAQRFVRRTFHRISDLAAVPIAVPAGGTVPLGEVARVQDGAADATTAAYVDGTPAVLLYVQKQSGANTVRVVGDVKDRLRSLQAALPAGYDLRITWDQAEYVIAATRAVEEHLLVGSLLAALVVLVFLWDWRATIITALAIPVSLISTFILLAVLHLTLNMFTLLALALVIGIVIDDAMVVLENIYRIIHEKGVPPLRAAIDGTREVGPAVMATTLSLIVVFLPLAFMSGIVGRFMTSFGWTMAFAIAVSLLVSFTLTPSLAARWLAAPVSTGGPSGEDTAWAQGRAVAPGETGGRVKAALERGYRWLLERSLRRRWVLVVLSILTLGSIVPLAGRVNQNFLPVDDESQFEVVVQAPSGLGLEDTSTLATRMAADIRHLSGVAYTIVTVGGDPQHTPNKFTIFVRMVAQDARKISQQQEMALVRSTILPLYRSANIMAVVNDISDIAGSAAPLEYVISGPDLGVLDHAVQTAIGYLQTLPGVVDVRSFAAPASFVDVKVNFARAAGLGLSASEVANVLGLLTQGVVARQVEYADGEQFYNVHIREGVGNRMDPLSLLQVPLISSTGTHVPLGQVVDVHPTAGASEIEHFNRQRQVTISANLLPQASLGGVVQKLDARMRSLGLPAQYHLGSTGIAAQVSKTKSAFAQTFTIAFVFMFLVLAAQFESWVHPITILLSLPLTVPFALISILLLHGSLNPLSYLGILVLFGVVKKNAILQVDRANRLRSQGLEKDAAIVRASLDRLRPILMTTIAFVAGMLPLAVSRGVGAATNQSISTAVIGGQMLSLLLTLVAVPVMYSLFDDLQTLGTGRGLFWRLRNVRRREAAPEAAAGMPVSERGGT